MLTTAQQIAGINRHLVTTDSFDLPVASGTMPGYVSDFGPDGMPGRRGQQNQVLNQAGTDDFQVVVGVPRRRRRSSICCGIASGSNRDALRCDGKG